MLFPSGANCSEFLLPGVVVTCFVTAGSVANSSKAYAKTFVWPATFDVTTGQASYAIAWYAGTVAILGPVMGMTLSWVRRA